MLSRLMLLSFTLFTSVITPSFATVGSLDLESQISLTGPSKSFYIGDSALRTYAMVERYVKGSCPADVSPEDLLEAVKHLGGAAYDPIREKASQVEVEDLRARLQSAYREGDPDIASAVSRVVWTRDSFAKKHVDEQTRASHCLGYVYRTLTLFLGEKADEDLLPGEGMMDRRFFAERTSSALSLVFPPKILFQVIRS